MITCINCDSARKKSEGRLSLLIWELFGVENKFVAVINLW